MLTDIEIAQQCRMRPITEIAATAGIDEEYLEQYGRYKAKIDHRLLEDRADRPDGKLILVTAINPTPAGEGKTTTSVGLADGLRKLGKSAVAALREPSLGPVFGVKGGAAGGGYAQVVPMEDINLHFTGDFHAIGAANNLLAAMLDNHIQQGNALGIDVKQITWKRCVDMNDRQLRHIIDGIGGKMQGVPREDGFDITVASEVMAVLCLASGITDLKERLGRMIVAYTYDGKPVTAHDMKAEGAMTALLKDALKPNLVQTLEGTPTLIHGGPFANIALGQSSVIADRLGLKLSDYHVTESGFGADITDFGGAIVRLLTPDRNGKLVDVVLGFAEPADYIENAVVSLHEPYASSASELVSELLQYLVPTSSILTAEAEAMLAGVYLDTKGFSTRTGVRTFEAAAYLRRAGAEASDVKRLFQSSFDQYMERQKIISSARNCGQGVIFAITAEQVDRIAAAQAADELLSIIGTTASVVAFRSGENDMAVSARAAGQVNVQLLMERLGGGGNHSAAGAQLRNTTPEEADRLITEAIRGYLEDQRAEKQNEH